MYSAHMLILKGADTEVEVHGPGAVDDARCRAEEMIELVSLETEICLAEVAGYSEELRGFGVGEGDVARYEGSHKPSAYCCLARSSHKSPNFGDRRAFEEVGDQPGA